MPPPPAPRHAIIRSYRLLYRHALRAVQYSPPNRFVVRDRLRRAFRESGPDAYDAERIRNTVRFLDAAARDKGLEHRLVKSLCGVWAKEGQQWRMRAKDMADGNDVLRMLNVQAYDQFYWNLRMLNESMGLCIR